MGYDAIVTMFLGARVSRETAQLYVKTFHPETYEKLQKDHDGDWVEFISEEYSLKFDDRIEFEYNSYSMQYYIICSDIINLYDYRNEFSRLAPIDLTPNTERYVELCKVLDLEQMKLYPSTYISS